MAQPEELPQPDTDIVAAFQVVRDAADARLAQETAANIELGDFAWGRGRQIASFICGELGIDPNLTLAGRRLISAYAKLVLAFTDPEDVGITISDEKLDRFDREVRQALQDEPSDEVVLPDPEELAHYSDLTAAQLFLIRFAMAQAGELGDFAPDDAYEVVYARFETVMQDFIVQDDEPTAEPDA